MIDHLMPDIPRLYSAIAEWLACMIFILPFKKRFSKIKTGVIMAVMLVVQSGFMVVTEDVRLFFWIPCMIVAVFLMLFFIYVSCAIEITDAVYFVLIAFVVAEFMASIEWQVACYFRIANIRTIVDLAGIAILYAHLMQCCEMRARKELEAVQNVLQNQYAQYVQSKESIELINYKYHDLKHQIAVLRSEEDPQKREAFLDEMEAEIRQYEAQNKTGNKVLDTVLTSKSLYCNKNGITFTCVADGTLLDFMDVMDICSIFGNALDNAIECEMKIQDKEKRLIHVTVSRQKAFLILKFENYCEEKLQYQDGNIATTKKDKKYHGYGMKSIRYTVNKYGGAVTIDTKENWFDLKILIPIKEEQGN